LEIDGITSDILERRGMFQILIWAACGIIFGVGYRGMYLEKIAAKDKVKGTTGLAFFIIMVIIAIGFFMLSLSQGEQISNLFTR
jgi:hypothetical protein